MTNLTDSDEHELLHFPPPPGMPRRRLARGTARARPLRVLVADSDASIRHMLDETLRAHEVVEAVGVHDAELLLEDGGFDVVVADDLQLLAHVEVFFPRVCRVLYTGATPVDLGSLAAQGIVEHYVHRSELWHLLELFARLDARG